MVQVHVTEGILEGEEVQNEYGGTFYSFKGVPYAQPPVGDLRFKAPQPPQPWTGVRDATEFGPISYQFNLWDPDHQPPNMGEDCLYLNVYTPQIKPSSLLPVMFYIHGGGYLAGSGDDDYFGPEFLVRDGVILVTINYRLQGPGFLCLHTPEIPGNAGMKDMVAAIRNPTPTFDENLGVEWKPYTLENQEYLDLGNTLMMDSAPDKEEIELWESVFKQYLPKYSI
ncbi:unnamed protein product [Arctia plantaginis]|uniref:Carboxylesterase type B domain-containing protein n=1 Tax=Arctia plantaginis TaxID=874455 RepID=A0A8S1AQ74_ARCPL|nr:unnamed protein product [Arctia plantaginis]